MKIYHNINEIKFDTDRVITVGGFDGIHLGHQKIFNTQINKAKEQNLKKIVITFDPLPKTFFNNSPILLSTNEKINILKDLNIDEVFIMKFDENICKLSATNFIEMLINKIGFKVCVIGYNHTFGKNCEGNIDFLNKISNLSTNTFEVCGVESITKKGNIISSTLIKKMIAEGKIEEANDYLGYSFFITGNVIKGNEIGRKLGFPTANLNPPNNKIIPKNGVYFAQVNLQNESYFGVANVGLRPTIEKNSNARIEVHILDFNDDIYGNELKINFIKYIRPEQKFSNVNELAIQIKKDIEWCRN